MGALAVVSTEAERESPRKRQIASGRQEQTALAAPQIQGGVSDDKEPRSSGLLCRKIFSVYDVNKDGRLGLAELVLLFRDNGIVMDYPRARQLLEFFGCAVQDGITYQDFVWLLAESAREAPSPTDLLMAVPRCVFNSYDVKAAEVLEGDQQSLMLQDLGAAFGVRIEAFGNDDSEPVSFDDFLELLRATTC